MAGRIYDDKALEIKARLQCRADCITNGEACWDRKCTSWPHYYVELEEETGVLPFRKEDGEFDVHEKIVERIFSDPGYFIDIEDDDV